MVMQKVVRWRWICCGIFLLISLLFLSEGARREVGMEPFWYYIVLGVTPSLAVIIAARFSLRISYWLALGHDLLLTMCLLIGLAILPNYFGLVILYPLGVFVVEGVLIFVAVKRNAGLTGQ